MLTQAWFIIEEYARDRRREVLGGPYIAAKAQELLDFLNHFNRSAVVEYQMVPWRDLHSVSNGKEWLEGGSVDLVQRRIDELRAGQPEPRS